MIVAMMVFVFALLIFYNASTAIFNNVAVFENTKLADETAHLALNSMLLSSGEPWNWETRNPSTVSLFGLSFSPNVVEPAKAIALAHLLDDNATYIPTRTSLGLGAYEAYFRVSDSVGSTLSYGGEVVEGGTVPVDPKFKYSYKRLVIFDGSSAIFELVLSFGG